jgi:hypothetical protein
MDIWCGAASSEGFPSLSSTEIFLKVWSKLRHQLSIWTFFNCNRRADCRWQTVPWFWQRHLTARSWGAAQNLRQDAACIRSIQVVPWKAYAGVRTPPLHSASLLGTGTVQLYATVT